MAETNYEQVAPRYDQDRERFSVPRDAVIEGRISDRPTRVLDLGCGTGRWLATQAKEFTGSALELIGVDASSGMLREARAKGISHLLRARAEDLPLPNLSVDYVFTSFAFHHFADKERAMDEVTRLLRSGGVFHMINIEPTASDRWWLYRFFPDAKLIDAARFWEPQRIVEALEKRGFQIDIDTETTVEELDPTVALAEAERRVVSQLEALDDDVYEKGLADLRKFIGSGPSHLETVTSLLRVISTK